MFCVNLPHPVAQTDLKDKTPFIAKRHVIYYYGDSDSDITAAVGAKAIPTRAQRSQGFLCKGRAARRPGERNRAGTLPRVNKP